MAPASPARSIPVAVLSVCSTQYKTVLDALRGRKERFLFEEVEIGLKPSVMAFITMNPGYPGAGRGRPRHRAVRRRPAVLQAHPRHRAARTGRRDCFPHANASARTPPSA